MNQRGCQQHGAGCPKPGKRPLTAWKRYQTGDVPTAADVAKWRRRWPTANWALAAGPGSGLVLLDKDGADAAPLDLPPTVRVRTGRAGGEHFYCAWPVGARLKNTVGFRPGWDIRAQGGLLILPGSRHPSGRRYQLDRDSLAHGLADVPPGLLTTLQTPARVTDRASVNADTPGGPPRARPDAAAALAGVPEGQRDATLFQLAATLQRAGVPQVWAERLVLESAAACSPPFPADAAREKVTRLYAAPPDAAHGEWVPRAQLDQAHAENAELRASLRAATEEITALKRQAPDKFVHRLVAELSELEKDRRTRGLSLQTIVTLRDAYAAMAHGQPADAPLPWRYDERQTQLGAAPNTQRKRLDLLIAHDVLATTYRDIGQRGSADWRQELNVSVQVPLTGDLPDDLQTVRRALRERPPRPKVLKRRGPCPACLTARCPQDPDAPLIKSVVIHCAACGGEVVPAHRHVEQAPSAQPVPAVLQLRPPLADPTPPVEPERKFCVQETRDVERIFCVQVAATAPAAAERQNCVQDAAAHVAASAAATLDLIGQEAAALPAAAAVALRLCYQAQMGVALRAHADDADGCYRAQRRLLLAARAEIAGGVPLMRGAAE